MTRISVLGPISATREGDRVDLGGPTQRKLLAVLVAAGGTVVSVADLLEALWGDEPPPSGPTTIQSYVSRLRKALGADTIVTDAPGYRFEGADIEVDREAFIHGASELPAEPLARIESISRLIAMWRGPAFEDFDSLDISARSLQEQRLSLEEELARLFRDRGDFAESLAAANRVIAAEPLRESAWMARATTLHAANRLPEAIAVMSEYRRNLTEIGLEPTREFSELETTIFEAPPPALRFHVPVPADAFFGRDDIRRLLEESLRLSRLTTITGPGGMGKTRLALEVLASSSTTRQSAMVSLGSISGNQAVVPAILDSLAVESRGDPLDALIARLKSWSGLLFLDNCEHVVDEVARVVQRILADSQATVVATSRETINISGEAIVPLGPLDATDAVGLFMERATRANPHLEAADRDVELLCELVDFMPLAIEMAASRVSAMSPPEMIRKLGDRLDVLNRLRRGDSPRHQTLQALVDWSYELLGDEEQLVFQRLAVLSGVFDLDSATEIAGFGPVPPEAVAGHLATLVERSLVSRRQQGGFRMLRVLKSFALDRLVEIAETRKRHAYFHGRQARAIGVGLGGPDELSWIDVAQSLSIPPNMQTQGSRPR